MDRSRPLPRHRRIALLLILAASLIIAVDRTTSAPVGDAAPASAQLVAQALQPESDSGEASDEVEDSSPARESASPAPAPTPRPSATSQSSPAASSTAQASIVAAPTVQPEPTAATLAAKLPVIANIPSVPTDATAANATGIPSTVAAVAGDPTASVPAAVAPVMPEDAPDDSPNPAPLRVPLPEVTVEDPIIITTVLAPPAQPEPEPVKPKLTAAERAVAWAFAELDSANPAYSDQMRRYWSGYCEAFVEIAYGTRYRYPSALADYYDHAAAGLVHRDDDPPAGAFVYYSGGRYGHVALSIGDGEVITTWGNIGQRYTVRRVGIHAFSNRYLGWSYGYTEL